MKQLSPKIGTAPILILLASFSLRLIDSATRSVWFDEAVEYLTASVPLAQLPSAIIISNYQPPLNSYLLHFWLQVSIQPLWLRYFYLSFTMFTVAGLMSWANFYWGKRGVLVVGVITAVMPSEIYYAQDIGEYALLVCLLTYALYFLDLARHKTQQRYWFWWALFSIGSIFTHYGAVIIILPISLAVLLNNVQHRQGSQVKQQLIFASLSTLISLPLLLYFLPPQLRRVSDTALAQPFSSLGQELWQAFSAIPTTFSYHLTGYPLSPIPQQVGWIVILLFGLLALTFSWRNGREAPLLWLGLAYLFYFALVRLGVYVGFGLRYGLIFTPLLVMVLAWVIVRLLHSPAPFTGWLLLVGLTAVQLYSTPHPTLSHLIRGSAGWSPEEDLQQAFTYWHNNRTAAEPTFVYYGALPATLYYAHFAGLADQATTKYLQGCSAAKMLPICTDNQLYFQPWSRHLTTEEKVAEIFASIGQMPRQMWLLFSHTHQNEETEMLQALQTQYKIVAHYQAGDPTTAAAYLLQKK